MERIFTNVRRIEIENSNSHSSREFLSSFKSKSYDSKGQECMLYRSQMFIYHSHNFSLGEI